MNLVGPPPFSPFASLGYAWLLLDRDAPGDMSRAEAILTMVLSSQEPRPGHADFGHFRMSFLDPGIADLNAVQLLLIELIPIAKLFSGRLAPPLCAAVRTSIEAGLAALEEIAAHLTYTNVAVLDVANRMLAGEFLGDAGAVARGVTKLDDFLRYTNRHGGFRDYNSPTYLGQMLSTVATLANHTADPATAAKAEIIQERLWLQTVTHYHAGLAQFAGPYCRAYPPDVIGGQGQMKAILYAFLDEERLLAPGAGAGDLTGGAGSREAAGGSGLARMSAFSAFHLATRAYYVPAYLLQLIAEARLPAIVREGGQRDQGLALTSWLGESHTLGTADKGFGSQARDLIVQAAPRASSFAPKTLFSRYLAHGESLDLNTFDVRLADWGPFAGLQSGPRSLALYGVGTNYRKIDWLGVEFFLLGAETDDALWLADRRVRPGERLPAERWLFFDLGATYVALYPFAPTPLGAEDSAPVALHQEDGFLRLTIANYDGPEKHFWKYAVIPWEHPEPGIGPFYNGNLHAGFAIETADAADWTDFSTFRRAVSESRVMDAAEGSARRVSFARDGKTLELAIDLITFDSVERLVDGQPEEYVFLDAPRAVQLSGEEMRLNGLAVRANRAGPWVVDAGERLHLTNPTFEPVVVRAGDADVNLSPFGRTTVDR